MAVVPDPAGRARLTAAAGLSAEVTHLVRYRVTAGRLLAAGWPPEESGPLTRAWLA